MVEICLLLLYTWICKLHYMTSKDGCYVVIPFSYFGA